MSRKIALDLSKFKHVNSDDNTTTLQHKDGHTLTIAHSKLTDAFKTQLSALSKMAGKGQATAADQQEAQAEAPQKLADGGVAGMSEPVNSNESVWDTLKDKASSAVSNAKAAVTPSSTPANTTGSNGHYKSMATGDEYAHGGKVQKFADGGMADQAPTQASDISTQDPSLAQPPAEQTQQAIGKDLVKEQAGQAQQQSNFDVYNHMRKMAGGATPNDMFGPNGEPPKNPVSPQLWSQAKVAPDDLRQLVNQQRIQADAPGKMQQQQEHDQVVAQNSTNAELGLPQVPDPGQPQASAPQPQAPVGDQLQQPQLQPPGAQQGSDPTDPMNMLTAGYKNQIAGANAMAQAQGDLGKQQAQIYQQQLAIQQQTQDHYQQAYQSLDKERQGVIADIKNGYIDPDQYWKGVKNPDTGEMEGGHSKIMAGIGILLAGFNNTGNAGGNAAMNNIHYQMDKNIEAQSKNLQAKDNLLAHNIQQFGNVKDGVMMTRIMQNDMLADKIGQAAGQSASPIAKANAQNAVGQIQATNAPLFQQFAMRRAMMNMANGGNAAPGALEHMVGMLRVMNPEMAKEMEGRMIPGAGPNGSTALATIPIPNEVRTKLVGFQNIDNLSNDLLKFAHSNSTLVPGTATYNVGAQKALQLQSAIREGQLGTVYKAGEQPLLDKFVNSNPAGAMKMLTTVPQLKSLLQTNKMQADTLKKSYGLPVQQAPQEPQYKTVNGVKYMRGPNGEAIKVK